jgi:lipopolysaccharide export system permease protein
MKTLHFYLLREMLLTLLMTVAVFTFVLLLANGLKEILVLLINRKATLWGVTEAFALLIPFVFMFALPMGMLTASLLVFGRFSADQELTAVRSSGVSLISLITPVLILSLGLCGISAWINMDIAPRCRVEFHEILKRMGYHAAATMIPEGQFVGVGGYTIYVKSVSGDELQDVLAFGVDPSGGYETLVSAPRGHIEVANDQAVLQMFGSQTYVRPKGSTNWGPASAGRIEIPIGQKSATQQESLKVSDMTFSQLQNELQRLEGQFSTPNSPDLTPEEVSALRKKLVGQKIDFTLPVRVQMHRQIAFSFASFGFALVGIPLGIRAHRRETNAGFAMALLLVLVYYSFVILAQTLETRSEWAPHLILWLPNFIFQGVGSVMLWRANRGI